MSRARDRTPRVHYEEGQVFRVPLAVRGGGLAVVARQDGQGIEAVGGAMRELDRLAQAALREAARHKRRLADVEHIQTLLQASG